MLTEKNVHGHTLLAWIREKHHWHFASASTEVDLPSNSLWIKSWMQKINFLGFI